MLKFLPTLVLSLLLCSIASAAPVAVEFQKQVLDNGLTVIYAPMRNAPVVHVRLTYHVGSRDEAPDRQGFAHMFEHMMFRGSAHVGPEEHMRRISEMGGACNAFTSFDRTVYHQTAPSSATELILWLEADRMASFKVNDAIFQTERKVVAEEWRMRYANQPLGGAMADLYALAYSKHNYRWLPIGDLEQLAKASSAELQTFYNRFYVPNNATLVIAGDIDLDKTKKWVERYFAWVPRGEDVQRTTPVEPEQTAPRRLVVSRPNVSLTNLYIGFKVPGYASDDTIPLMLLAEILSSGRTGRLDRQLVTGDSPTCVRVGTSVGTNVDPGLLTVTATLKPSIEPEAVEASIRAVIDAIVDGGVEQEELDRVRARATQGLIRRLQLAEDVAEMLSVQQTYAGDASRFNTLIDRVNAVIPADIQRVASVYLSSASSSTVVYRKGAGEVVDTNISEALKASAVVASDRVVEPRVKGFPDTYPTTPPATDVASPVVFSKGAEATLTNGAKAITLTDARLPIVNVTVVFPVGSDHEPTDKAGLAQMTAALLRRGTANVPFLEIAERLESSGITVEATDSGDHTRVRIGCTSDQLDYAIEQAALILAKPDFAEAELTRLARQASASLSQSLTNPATVADRTLNARLHAGGPPAKQPTPASYLAITAADVRAWYERVYVTTGATVLLSGDVAPDRAHRLAEELLSGLRKGDDAKPGALRFEPAPPKQVILVDNPQGKQATILLGVRAYSLESDDKFAGMLAGHILSTGIHSRLGRYLRAEKGLTYGARARFNPKREWGEFRGSVDTDPATTAEAIAAMFKVFDDMKSELVSESELAEARARVVGQLAMETQTASQQADRRINQILNGYPIDYYDTLPQRLAAVTAEQVRDVMREYVVSDRFQFVVVGPRTIVERQLSKIGSVDVIPMESVRAAE